MHLCHNENDNEDKIAEKLTRLNNPAALALNQGSPANRHRHRTTPPSFILLIRLNNLSFAFQSITQTTHYHQNTDHNHDDADIDSLHPADDAQ